MLIYEKKIIEIMGVSLGTPGKEGRRGRRKEGRRSRVRERKEGAII